MYIGDLPDGRAVVMSAATDVTKRNQMVQQLKESEQRFKILHNASFGGIAVHRQRSYSRMQSRIVRYYRLFNRRNLLEWMGYY